MLPLKQLPFILYRKNLFNSEKHKEVIEIIALINSSSSSSLSSDSYYLNCGHKVSGVAKILSALAEEELKQKMTCSVCAFSVVIVFSDSVKKEVVEKIIQVKNICLPEAIIEMQRNYQSNIDLRMPGYSARFEPVDSIEDSLALEKISFNSANEDSTLSGVSFSSNGKFPLLEVTIRKVSEKENKELEEWLEGSSCSLTSNSIKATGIEQVKALIKLLLIDNFFPPNSHFTMMNKIVKVGNWNRVQLKKAAPQIEKIYELIEDFYNADKE